MNKKPNNQTADVPSHCYQIHASISIPWNNFVDDIWKHFFPFIEHVETISVTGILFTWEFHLFSWRENSIRNPWFTYVGSTSAGVHDIKLYVVSQNTIIESGILMMMNSSYQMSYDDRYSHLYMVYIKVRPYVLTVTLTKMCLLSSYFLQLNF